MEIVWTLLLTACLTDTDCKYQDVQFFATEEQCLVGKLLHEDIPSDGDWKSVTYNCKPYGSKEA